jgi:multidrug resistance efflux pump
MTRQRIWRAAIGLAALLLVGAIATALRSNLTPASSDTPVAHVKRGDLNLRIFANGELSAQHTAVFIAPPIGGGSLQITRLLRTGSPVKTGDVIFEFDPSEQQYKLEQNRSDLLQAEQEIAKANADADVQTAQDKSALLKAKFDVRRAELDVSKNELLSSIDAKKNDLALSEAKRALQQLETDIQSHAASNQAGIAVAKEKHNKAELAMKQAEQNIASMQVHSTIDGLVVVEKNTSASQMFFDGMTIPEYREGDQAQPGSVIARVLDPAGMELTAKVGEVERGNLQIGQLAEVHLDSLPGVTFHGKVKTAGGAASQMFFESNHTFDITLGITDADARLRPGFSAQVIFLGNPRKDVLYLPRSAIFKKDDKPIVYVKSGSGFEPREVKISLETEGRVAVEGLKEGTEVALVSPEARTKKSVNTGGPDAMGGGSTP